MTRKIFKKILNTIITFVLISIAILTLNPSYSEAKIEFSDNDEGIEVKRSIENLKDLDSQNWQLVTYPRLGNEYQLVLRIVGFKGSLRLNHPASLEVRSGIKSWSLKDITLGNTQLAMDNRDAAAEFDLEPLMKDLKNNRPLRLALRGGFNELPIPPYVVNEWRSIGWIDES